MGDQFLEKIRSQEALNEEDQTKTSAAPKSSQKGIFNKQRAMQAS